MRWSVRRLNLRSMCWAMRIIGETKKYNGVVKFQAGIYKFSGSWNVIDGYVEKKGIGVYDWKFNFGIDYRYAEWEMPNLVVPGGGTLSFSVTGPYGGFIGSSTEFTNGEGASVLNIRFIPSKPNFSSSIMVTSNGSSD